MAVSFSPILESLHGFSPEAEQARSTNRLQQMYMGQQIKQGQAQEGRAQQEFDHKQVDDEAKRMVGLFNDFYGPWARQAKASGDARGFLINSLRNPAFRQRVEQDKVFDVNAIDPNDPDLTRDVEMLAGFGLPKAGELQLESVVGEDGKPTLLPRPQAIGKQPYEKPPSQPNSYGEYKLAQNDPEYAEYLKSLRRKGITINPDGSIEIGGSEGTVGPGEISGPTKNKLQESIVQAGDELDRLNSIGNSVDPKFLTIQGRALGAAMKLKDITGGLFGQMTPEEQDYLRRYSTFRADSGKNLSTIMNRLSGAAISPAEAERLKKGIPTDEDSPTQFQAKYTSAVKDVTRATMRANWALKNGLGVRSVDQLSQVMPLDAIDQVYEQKANQIWQQLGGTPETKQQAIQQANQEFGLAR